MHRPFVALRSRPSGAPVAALVLGLATTTGCAGQKFNYPGESLWERFPLDGERQWSYVSDDVSVEYSLIVDKISTVSQGGKDVVTLAYTHRTSDGGETLQYEVDWSTDADDGIEIWKWTDYSTDVAGVTTNFDPPVVFAEREMNAGDIVETSTGGDTFATEYVGLTTCPNQWTTDEWECAVVTIGSGTGSQPFLGTWSIARSYGPSWIELDSTPGKFVLADAFQSAGE